MKFSLPVTCHCCEETFSVNVTGTQYPEDALCPKCHATIWLVQPLGNLVGTAIRWRADSEFQAGDWTIAIVLSAMAVECDMAFLFMKWNRVELMVSREPNAADEEEWETKWRDTRAVGARLEKLSSVLSGRPFDLFLSENHTLLHSLHARYPASKSEPSSKEFFIKELFYRRNKIVHFGEVDFQQADAETCLTLATMLSQILRAMDAEYGRALASKSAKL